MNCKVHFTTNFQRMPRPTMVYYTIITLQKNYKFTKKYKLKFIQITDPGIQMVMRFKGFLLPSL